MERLVIVSDAHLGSVPDRVEEAFLAFLDHVPALGDGLLVNGDLFDFWFAYRRVIPRAGIRVVARLAELARRLPVAMTGGNHDRWGDRSGTRIWTSAFIRTSSGFPSPAEPRWRSTATVSRNSGGALAS